MQVPCDAYTPNCWSSSVHVLLVIIATFVGALYVALSVTLVGAFYSRDPTSSSPLSRPISRVMMVQLFVKTLLTVSFILLARYDSMRLVLLVMLLVGTTAVAVLYSIQLPFYRFEYNMLRVVTFWILSWASVCLLIIEFAGNANESATSVLFFVGIPVVIATSIVGVRFRRMSITRLHYTEMSSPTEIELKVRFLIEPVTEARRLRNLGLGTAPVTAAAGGSRGVSRPTMAAVPAATSAGQTKPPLSRAPTSRAMGFEQSGSKSSTTPAPASKSPYGQRSDGASSSGGGYTALDNMSDNGIGGGYGRAGSPSSGGGAGQYDDPSVGGRSVQRRLEQLEEERRAMEETGLLEQAEEIYAYGVQRFGNSAWMHLLRAQHCFYYSENKVRVDEFLVSVGR